MSELTRKIAKKLHGGVVSLLPKGPSRGDVLLSYTTLPFISPQLLDGHTNRWECKRMAEICLEAGYAVDIVDFDHPDFIPRKPYKLCIDIQNNLQRFATTLPKNCIKLFHATTSHWLFNNLAEYQRLLELQQRRGVTLAPQRTLPPSRNLEYADVITLLGNDVTAKTYAYANKPIIRIPISTTHLYPSPEQKDFTHARTRFIWLGGTGMVHKGLDLVLEAFRDLPHLHLTVFGKADTDFSKFYHRELQETPNIHFAGYVDPGSTSFIDSANQSVALIFPSSSEGSSGGVVTAMHAGLIPVISRESGVDIGKSGVILSRCDVAAIKTEVEQMAITSPLELKAHALEAWRIARDQHTREQFSFAMEAALRPYLS
jgi:glycosyltransferase involved in cell wall biosynthesis